VDQILTTNLQQIFNPLEMLSFAQKPTQTNLFYLYLLINSVCGA